MLVGKRVVQAVAQHAVIKLAVAHAVAPAGARDQIGRLIHALHAAGDRDIDIAEKCLLRGGDDGLRAGTADAIDRERRNRHRQSGIDGGLARRIHFAAGLNDVAHHHRLHVVGAKPGPRNGAADRDRAERRRRHVLERAAERAYRGAHRLGKDH